MLTTKDMQIIGNELKIIADELDLIYVRALNINDLNQLLQKTKVEKPLLVYANMNEIEFPNDLTNYEYGQIEVNIYVLNLHVSADPTAEQIDELLTPLYNFANYIYDKLTRSEIVNPAADVERISLTSADAIELTDENLGGYELKLTVPLKRSYNCD